MPHAPLKPSRRRVLRWGLGLGATATAGTLGARWLLPPSPRADRATFDELAAELIDALDPDDRAVACVPYDSPWRQVYNRGVWGAGLDIRPWSQSGTVRQLVSDLAHSGLSRVGRERVNEQFFLRWPGIHIMRLLVCGDPRDGACTALLTAPHLNLRVGGASTEGVAFGGPQVWGDQRGDNSPGLPGNVYLPQLHAAWAVFDAMTPAQRAAARVRRAPVQTCLTVRGAGATFDGVPIGELGERARGLARDAVARMLETWPDDDVAYAWACLDAHGGVDALHLADYDVDHEGGFDAAGQRSHIVRMQGPAAVLYFRGEPHLHAFANVAMDAERPLSVGELLAENPVDLDEAGVRRWFERAMVAQAGADVAHYDLQAVAGRLRAGPVRTGDVYTVESWGNDLVALELDADDLRPDVAAAWRAAGHELPASGRVRVATSSYFADHEAEQRLGRVRAREELGPLRDALVRHTREHGLG